MTIEEAIKGLTVLSKEFSGYKPNEEMFDMAINALQAQESCNDLATNLQPSKQDADDTISRKAAINAIDVKNVNNGIISALQSIIEELPSAQPETHEKRTETHSCDLIERQAAIDAHYEYCNQHPDAGFPVWSLKILKDLPSAQPESDKKKISDLLRKLYLFGLVHFTEEGIVRKQHYCEELWKALFHDDEFPAWMLWT